MTHLQKIALLLISLSFNSCKHNEDEYIFDENRFKNIETLKLDKAMKTEREIGSKERTYNNTFGLGNDYYRNTNNYTLSYPKVYEKNQKNLKLETAFFYTRNDSLIKVIFYEWSPKTDTIRTMKTSEIKVFEEKLDNLKYLISKKLGKPKVVEIEKRKDAAYNYTDRYKWLENHLATDLYFYASGKDYRNIRLVIYKK